MAQHILELLLYFIGFAGLLCLAGFFFEYLPNLIGGNADDVEQ
jgi:hypothetical protein